MVIKARDLVKADLTLLGKGKSDPFVRVKGMYRILRSQRREHVLVMKPKCSRVIADQILSVTPLLILAQGNIEYKTKTVNNTTEPQWNEVDREGAGCTFTFTLTSKRCSNSSSNNPRATLWNSKSTTKIREKMISSEGKSSAIVTLATVDVP